MALTSNQMTGVALKSMALLSFLAAIFLSLFGESHQLLIFLFGGAFFANIISLLVRRRILDIGPIVFGGGGLFLHYKDSRAFESMFEAIHSSSYFNDLIYPQFIRWCLDFIFTPLVFNSMLLMVFLGYCVFPLLLSGYKLDPEAEANDK